VAGTRFTENVVRPLLEEYLTYQAFGLALAVLLVDALYFLIMGRFKRISSNRAARKAATAKLAAAPPPAPVPAPVPAAPPAPCAPGASPPAAPPAATADAPLTGGDPA
jgi:hypothetical protein